MKVKGDGSCLNRAVVSQIMSFHHDDVWTDRFFPGKKPGIKLATYEVVNDLKQLLSHKTVIYFKTLLIYMPQKKLMTLSKKRKRSGILQWHQQK